MMPFIGAMIYSMWTDDSIKTDGPTIAEKDALLKRENGVSEQSPMRLRMEQFIKQQQKQNHS